MEHKIAEYFLKCAKFEHFLIRGMPNLRKKCGGKITGVRWDVLAKEIESKHPFSEFAFEEYSFAYLEKNCPQFLTEAPDKTLKWDSDIPSIDSWVKLLNRSFAQIRNNIAHGNKAHPHAYFTSDRTSKFIEAGDALMAFIAKEIFSDPYWEEPIAFA